MNQIASLMDMVIIREPWIDDALCAQTGGDDYFPDAGDREVAQRAIDMCRRCDVAAECLEYALRANETRGVWGGKTQRQLRRIRRQS